MVVLESYSFWGAECTSKPLPHPASDGRCSGYTGIASRLHLPCQSQWSRVATRSAMWERCLWPIIRRSIPSGLRPVELLWGCGGFVTQHNLVILCPSVTGLLLQRGGSFAASFVLSLVAHHLFASWLQCLIPVGLLHGLLVCQYLRLLGDIF